MGWANILVIDDNEDICDMVELTLKVKYNIFKALDGITALRILEKEKIDMVITDLVMPGVDGLKLTEKLKSEERFKDIIVIVITGTTAGEELPDTFWQMATNSTTIHYMNIQLIISRRILNMNSQHGLQVWYGQFLCLEQILVLKLMEQPLVLIVPHLQFAPGVNFFMFGILVLQIQQQSK